MNQRTKIDYYRHLITCIEFHQYELFDWIIQYIDWKHNPHILKKMIKKEFFHGLEMIDDILLDIDVDCDFIEYHMFRLENKIKGSSSALVDASRYGLTDFLIYILDSFSLLMSIMLLIDILFQNLAI